jgi:peptidyl-Lys metalloendopeptidase
MKLIWKLLASALLASCVTVVNAAPKDRGVDAFGDSEAVGVVATSLSTTKAYHRSNEDVVVGVVFSNTSAAPVMLANWLFDSSDPDRSFLKVSRDGQPADYFGALVKRTALTADEATVLQPGESVTVNYELSSLFNLAQGGVFEVAFSGSAKHAIAGQTLSSGAISLAVEADPFRSILSAIDHTKAAGAGGVSYSGTKCTASKKADLMTALVNAETYAGGAVTYLSGTPSATTRYTTWFGTFSTANWNTVKTHYTNIRSVYNTQPIVFDCGCTKKTTYAYVYPSQPYKIYLCGAFWSAPATGTDSKAGTLVHETSHFTVVAGTQDYAYGQTAAKSLALSNPAQAIMNADSHEYFAENTPAQP